MLACNYTKGYFHSINSLIISKLKFKYNDAYYIPKKPIIFNQGKCQLISSSSIFYSLTSELFFASLSGFSLSQSIKYAFHFKLLPSMLFFSSFLYTSKLVIGQKANKRNIITSLALYDKGNKVQVHLNKGSKSKDIDIKLFRQFTTSEKKFYKTLPIFKNKTQDYYPVIIDDRLYLMKKSIKVLNKEILTAVLQGKYIKLNQSIQEENTVNI